MNHALSIAVLLELAALAAAQAAPTPAPAAPGQPGKPWQDALVLARRHHAPILAFVLPAEARADGARVQRLEQLEQQVGMLRNKAGPAAAPATTRDVLLRELQLLRRAEPGSRRPAEPSAARALFALAVPVVCRAEDCGATPGENVVLCGEDGKRTHGFALDLLDRDAFVQRVGATVLAPATLAARRANVPPALTADIARRAKLAAANGTDPKEVAELEAIEQRLVDALPALAPALLETVDGALRVQSELARLEAQRAPLGTRAEVHAVDPCPTCGMGYVPPELNTVLRLIGP
jgi:hypothetical protein